MWSGPILVSNPGSILASAEAWTCREALRCEPCGGLEVRATMGGAPRVKARLDRHAPDTRAMTIGTMKALPRGDPLTESPLSASRTDVRAQPQLQYAAPVPRRSGGSDRASRAGATRSGTRAPAARDRHPPRPRQHADQTRAGARDTGRARTMPAPAVRVMPHTDAPRPRRAAPARRGLGPRPPRSQPEREPPPTTDPDRPHRPHRSPRAVRAADGSVARS